MSDSGRLQQSPLKETPLSPEVVAALLSSDQWVTDNAPLLAGQGADLAGNPPGRFGGLVVAWNLPGAAVPVPDVDETVVVTPEGFLMQAPFLWPPLGLAAQDAPRAVSASAAEQDLEAATFRVVASDYAPNLEGSHLASVPPAIAGFVVSYPWGQVVVLPDGTVYKPVVYRDGVADRLIVRPLTGEDRARLDALSAEDAIRTYIETPDDNVQYYLSDLSGRRTALAMNTVGRQNEKGAAISEFEIVSGVWFSSFPAKPVSTPVAPKSGPDEREYTISYRSSMSANNGEPAGRRGSFCIVVRGGADAPWKVKGCGTGP